MPPIRNASNASQNNSQLYGIYQPPNGSPYNSHGSNATDVNPVHIANNTGWGSAPNWSNGQSSTSAPSRSLPSTTPEASPEETPDNIPGLYQKIGRGLWKCTFGECTKITHYRRDRTRHIGKHAKWEDRQIAAGLLRPEDAIAIPWRKVHC
ncbi:hypothetical protein Clacol_009742 [Clathrus columnatus]|uniref:C2H2-type domain-containing protein n=1 Tax=Clathrus columnatus TaxID=1419009 RepID=A0AAV5ALG6_9AGAM|nr:hypothetical protein Clacol_009742 [Clathrus columnatus]